MDLPSSTLVFDTETNGLPLFKSPPSHPQQPYITQLGAILYDSSWRPVTEINFLVKPVGWTVPAEVTAITGISTEMCETYGLPIDGVLSVFRGMAARAQVCVAHNFKFDELLTEAQAHRCAQPPLWPGRKVFCTMNATTNWCKFPGPYGFKWPKLIEVYEKMFGEKFTGAHDAMVDVRACGRVFNYGLRNNIFSL